MGQRVQTLEDLLRPGLSVVCVGINPSRVSVETGHHYQGLLGKLFFSRLRRVDLLRRYSTLRGRRPVREGCRLHRHNQAARLHARACRREEFGYTGRIAVELAR
jgi:hypothetical protein